MRKSRHVATFSGTLDNGRASGHCRFVLLERDRAGGNCHPPTYREESSRKSMARNSNFLVVHVDGAYAKRIKKLVSAGERLTVLSNADIPEDVATKLLAAVAEKAPPGEFFVVFAAGDDARRIRKLLSAGKKLTVLSNLEIPACIEADVLAAVAGKSPCNEFFIAHAEGAAAIRINKFISAGKGPTVINRLDIPAYIATELLAAAAKKSRHMATFSKFARHASSSRQRRLAGRKSKALHG